MREKTLSVRQRTIDNPVIVLPSVGWAIEYLDEIKESSFDALFE